jgi:hypothetical protein
MPSCAAANAILFADETMIIGAADPASCLVLAAIPCMDVYNITAICFAIGNAMILGIT